MNRSKNKFVNNHEEPDTKDNINFSRKKHGNKTLLSFNTNLNLLKTQMYTAHNKFQIAPFYFYYDLPLIILAFYLFI